MQIKEVLDLLFSVRQRKRSFFILLTLLLSTGLKTVYGAEQDILLQQPQTVPQSEVVEESLAALPTNLKELFDADYYAFQNPDVVLTVGYDKEKLYEHFLNYGLKEGRVCSKYFDLVKYRALYPDLAEVYLDNLDLYIQHFFTFGVYEGRSCGIESVDKVYRSIVAGGLPINSVFSQMHTQPQTQFSESLEETLHVNSDSIISDNAGNILIPFEVINREPYLTLETLKERCGDSLIIITDIDGNITFVGGNFSSVNVDDSDSAKESLHCMMQLLKFPEDTRVLEYVASGKDTDNNTYYRFVAKTLDGLYLKNSAITVSVNTNGEVLSVSNSSPNRWNTEAENIWPEIVRERENLQSQGYEFMLDEFQLSYSDLLNRPFWYNYYQDKETDKLVVAVLFKENGKLYFISETAADSMEGFDISKYRGGHEDILNQDLITVDKEFVDYYGRIITLPTVEENGKWYLYDKDKNLLGIDGNTNEKLFFDEEYFDFVNQFKTNPATLDEQFKQAYESENSYLTYYIGRAIYISAFETIQNEFSRDINRSLLVDNDKLMLIRYFDNPGAPYMEGGANANSCYVNIHNSLLAVGYDGVTHEAGHCLNFLISGYLPSAYAVGAIAESYGDIFGNLAEMMQENLPSYCDRENWLLSEANGFRLNSKNGQYVITRNEAAKDMEESLFAKYALKMKDLTYIRYNCEAYIKNMSNPHDEYALQNYGLGYYSGSSSSVGDEYFIDNTYENYSLDNGGIHFNALVLDNVCYNLYQELHALDESFGYEQLYNIWLDSIQYLNADTLYGDVATYVKQSMINKDYSNEAIDAAMKCFEDANVYDYVPNEIEHAYIKEEPHATETVKTVENTLEQSNEETLVIEIETVSESETETPGEEVLEQESEEISVTEGIIPESETEEAVVEVVEEVVEEAVEEVVEETKEETSETTKEVETETTSEDSL